MRLHMPSANLAKQMQFSAGDKSEGSHDIELRTLKPGEGVWVICLLSCM